MTTKDLYDAIVKDGGFSTNIYGKCPVTGYMVSLPGYETIVPLSVVYANYDGSDMFIYSFVNALTHAMPTNDDNLYVGAWVDNDKVYFDISENVQDLQVALQLAKERNQLAIFDLASFESIRL